MLPVTEADPAHIAAVSDMLRQLQFPNHRFGYNHLIIAVTRYAQGDILSLSKELYPYVAEHFGCTDGRAVEHAIRSAASDGWANGDPQAWALYFPRCRKVPSNKRLIVTLAERLRQNTPPENERG